MSRLRFSLVCLLALATAGCKAQTAPSTTISPDTSRRIDVLVRSKLDVPADYDILAGARTPSDMAGFDTILLTFQLPGHPEHAQTLPFLLSKDGTQLARLSKWDISRNPADLIPSSDRPVRGNPTAKVTIVNFDDLECPYCAKMHAELFPETLDHYKGLIRIVYRDLPLEQIHPWALHAAVDANCLAAQSDTAYWSYVDYLHTHGEDVSGPDRDLKKSSATLDKIAREQGISSQLNAAKLDTCVTKQDAAPVRAEMKIAEGLGIEQTPTLYINGEQLSGALPPADLWRIIDRALVAEGVQPPPNEYNKPAPPPTPPATAPAPAGKQ